MLNKFILTPFIIHHRFDEIKTLVKPSWVINEPKLSRGSSILVLSEILQSLATHVLNVVQSGFRPINIAGDCCSSISGLRHQNVMTVATIAAVAKLFMIPIYQGISIKFIAGLRMHIKCFVKFFMLFRVESLIEIAGFRKKKSINLVHDDKYIILTN